MPAEGLLQHNESLFIFGPLEAREFFGCHMAFRAAVQKLVVVHCLPSDQAVDVYLFEGDDEVNEILESPEPCPYIVEENRTHRVGWGESLHAQLWSEVYGKGHIILRHTPDERSQSPS